MIKLHTVPNLKILFAIVFFLFLLTAVGQAQLTTTGPVRPPGVDEGIRPATRDQVIIPGVPFYIWQHGCAPNRGWNGNWLL